MNWRLTLVPAALAEVLGGPTQPPAAAAGASSSAARSSGAASPWSAASPTSAKHSAEFDAFGAFGSASAGERVRGLSCAKVTGCLLACPCKSARQPSCLINQSRPIGCCTGAAFAAFPEPALVKPGGSPAGVISLTASAGAGGAAHSTDAQALPAYLFAEPTPVAYSGAISWGSHAAVAPPAVAHSAAGMHKPAAAVDEGADAFAEFDPFKQ